MASSYIGADVPCNAQLVARSLFYNNPKGDGVPPAWHLEHSALVSQTIKEDYEKGASVQREEPIKMVCEGITISGRMDTRSEWPSGDVVIRDAKTGLPRVSDQIQDLLNQEMEVTIGRVNPKNISGSLVYKNGHTQSVPYDWWNASAVQQRYRDALAAIHGGLLDITPSSGN